MKKQNGVESFHWDETGYQPLVFFDGWQTAILNWESVFDLDNIGEIERHIETDEVFVLVSGKAVLFSITESGELSVIEMIPNVIYNVTQSTWHNLIASKDAKWIIVENRDTHKNDTSYRELSDEERDFLIPKLPKWATDDKE